MFWWGWLAIALGGVPLVRAWQANRRTSLHDAILWAAAAWLSWGFAIAWPMDDDFAYLALCLTGCAGVAVLGARRPHVFAWNFVAFGLLSVMSLPLLESMVIRVHSFNIERKIFLAAILTVTMGNYLPTRFGAAAAALAIGCVLKYLRLLGWPLPFDDDGLVMIAVGLAPWLAWLAMRRSVDDPFDREWRDFRDRYGFVWGARIREQFNAAARNANVPVVLEWSGRSKEPLAAADLDEALALLRKTLKRFL